MDAHKQTEMEKMLETERARVEKELSDVGVQDPQNPDTWKTSGGEIDHTATESNELADRQEAFEEREEELRALTVRLQDVQDALKKIESGVYGVCEIGGEKIEEDRLEANPAARTCKAHMA